MKDILTVLVPVDFSKESEFALDWAQAVTRNKTGATVYLMHVLPLGMNPEQCGMAATAYDAEIKTIRSKMEKYQSQLPEDLISFPIYESGRIAEAVARICKDKNIDLVIMTTRGRRGLTHILEGSTTEETVRVAPCPVLVLHLNEKTQGTLRRGQSKIS